MTALLAFALLQPDFTELYRKAVADRESSLGPMHPKVAESWRDLGLYLRERKQPAAAQEALQRACSILEKHKPSPALADCWLETQVNLPRAVAILEANPKAALDFRTGVTLNNLATGIEENDPKLAERMYRIAVRIQEQAPADAEYASTLNNLASLLLRTGRAAAADPLQRKAVRIFEQQLGRDHPRLGVALSNLGDILRARNLLAEAEQQFRRVLAIDEAFYGPTHQEVLADIENLAGLLEQRGKVAEARKLRKRLP